MATATFALPRDVNGTVIFKFLDAYEAVRFNMATEPKYYGYLHPDGQYVIARHATDEAGEEHITFHGGDGSTTLGNAWANKATLDYVEYDVLVI